MISVKDMQEARFDEKVSLIQIWTGAQMMHKKEAADTDVSKWQNAIHDMYAVMTVGEALLANKWEAWRQRLYASTNKQVEAYYRQQIGDPENVKRDQQEMCLVYQMAGLLASEGKA